MLLILEICLIVAFNIMRSVYICVRQISWEISGISRHLRNIITNNKYMNITSLHVQTVLYRYSFDILEQQAGEHHFITQHHSFQKPEYVLQENITLYSISMDKAIFIEVEKGVDVASSKLSSFIKESQFKHAKRIIIMPVNVFHSLAEKIGTPNGTLVFIGNTSRCGSTLLTQIFEETDNGIGFNEPDALNEIYKWKWQMTEKEYHKWLLHGISMLCKPLQGKTVYAIKILPIFSWAQADFTRIFHNAKFIFMYRNGIEVAKSICLMSNVTPILRMSIEIGRRYPRLFMYILRKNTLYVPPVPEMEKFDVSHPVNFCLYLWAMHISLYSLLPENFQIAAVKYEYLVENPHRICKQLFETFGLHYDTSAVEKAFARDSQDNSIVSRKNLAKYKKLKLEKQDLLAANRICEGFGFPLTSESHILPGTLC